MESLEDSNSSDMFEEFSNDNQHNRKSIEGCSSLGQLENAQDITLKEGKETSCGALRKNNFQSVPRVPKVSVQEKIIVCIENSQDKCLGYTFSGLDENRKEPNPHAIRNEAIRMMMLNKLTLAKDTEFAIASVEPGKLKWVSPFTSDIIKLSKSLSEFKVDFNEESNNLDITSIFSGVLLKIDVPVSNSSTVIPPNYVVRIIFVYSSSHLIPQVSTNDPSYTKFVMSPYCFLDVLYLHEKQSEFNNVERIYHEFGNIVSHSSYLLESSRDVTNVFNKAMKLLAHPNQRVSEAMWNF